MPMADTIATAADYADAMMTARKAKNLLFLLLLLVLLAQLSIFFVAAYTDFIVQHEPAAATTNSEEVVAATLPSTAPAGDEGVILKADSEGVSASASNEKVTAALRLLTGLCAFVGVMLPLVLTFILLLIVGIMLVGRLIGVSRLTSAYIWTIVLLVLLFPWQAFLDPSIWRWPGALYTWDELMSNGQFMHTDGKSIFYYIVGWGRFVAAPVIALLILLSIQVKSNRGMRQALGESVTDVSPVV